MYDLVFKDPEMFCNGKRYTFLNFRNEYLMRDGSQVSYLTTTALILSNFNNLWIYENWHVFERPSIVSQILKQTLFLSSYTARNRVVCSLHYVLILHMYVLVKTKILFVFIVQSLQEADYTIVI